MKPFSVILIFVLCFGLCACSGRAFEIFDRLIEECEDLPSGVIYRSDAEEGNESFFSPSVRNSMYGEDSEKKFALIEEYSIYLSSFASPYEIGVFKCYTTSGAESVEFMCRGRADILRVALRETDFQALCDDVRIIRRGNFVIFIMTDGAADLERLAKRLIG